jgi:hypothetical protein
MKSIPVSNNTILSNAIMIFLFSIVIGCSNKLPNGYAKVLNPSSNIKVGQVIQPSNKGINQLICQIEIDASDILISKSTDITSTQLNSIESDLSAKFNDLISADLKAKKMKFVSFSFTNTRIMEVPLVTLVKDARRYMEDSDYLAVIKTKLQERSKLELITSVFIADFKYSLNESALIGAGITLDQVKSLLGRFGVKADSSNQLEVSGSNLVVGYSTDPKVIEQIAFSVNTIPAEIVNTYAGDWNVELRYYRGESSDTIAKWVQNETVTINANLTLSKDVFTVPAVDIYGNPHDLSFKLRNRLKRFENNIVKIEVINREIFNNSQFIVLNKPPMTTKVLSDRLHWAGPADNYYVSMEVIFTKK